MKLPGYFLISALDMYEDYYTDLARGCRVTQI